MRIIYPAIICLSLLSFDCYAADLTITQGPTKRVLSDEDLKQLHLDTIEVEDPLYKKQKRYAGYWLLDILHLAGIQADPRTVWVFTALDGFKARIAAADVINTKAKAFIAIQDMDAPSGDWEKVEDGKEMISPGPYYLVWQVPADAPKDIQLAWPYQIADISIIDINEAKKDLFPEGTTGSTMRGYKVFQQNCIACHSLNLEGGTIGPELNVPRNVLEYQDRKFLKAFIENPSAFQAKNKMPGFAQILPSQSIDDVLDYLNWMGQHKKEIAS